MRQVHDPYGGVNPLIDKMIGNAYDIVKYVARYLREIRYVAENMEYVYNAAHNKKVVVEEQAQGNNLYIPLPSGVSMDNLENVEVIALDGSQVFFPASNTFNYGVDHGEVVISISPSLTSATFRCTFRYSTE